MMVQGAGPVKCMLGLPLMPEARSLVRSGSKSHAEVDVPQPHCCFQHKYDSGNITQDRP